MTLRREVLPSGEASINLPVNMRRLIWNAQERFQCNKSRDSPTGGSSRLLATHSQNGCHTVADIAAVDCVRRS